MNTRILKEADYSGIISLRHKLHKFPSLSGDEGETAAIVTEFLKRCNPDQLFTKVGGNGVVAVFKGNTPGRKVLVRCELDALPIEEKTILTYTSVKQGIAHSCGHDGHMAVLCAVAKFFRPEEGELILAFQPEEEVGTGAFKMVADLYRLGIDYDYVLAPHNLPGKPEHTVVTYPVCFAWASVGLKVTFSGRPSHACEPGKAKNPTLAICKLVTRLNNIKMKTMYHFCTIIGVSIGDHNYGITPGEGYIELTLRAQTDKKLETFVDYVKSVILEYAPGFTVSFSESNAFKAAVNDEDLNELVGEVARAQGFPTAVNKLGSYGSDDVFNFAKEAKLCCFHIGAGIDRPPMHDPSADFNDALIPQMTELICCVYQQIQQKL